MYRQILNEFDLLNHKLFKKYQLGLEVENLGNQFFN